MHPAQQAFQSFLLLFFQFIHTSCFSNPSSVSVIDSVAVAVAVAVAVVFVVVVPVVA